MSLATAHMFICHAYPVRGLQVKSVCCEFLLALWTCAILPIERTSGPLQALLLFGLASHSQAGFADSPGQQLCGDSQTALSQMETRCAQDCLVCACGCRWPHFQPPSALCSLTLSFSASNILGLQTFSILGGGGS